jgi:hypothetical protein
MGAEGEECQSRKYGLSRQNIEERKENLIS